MDPPTQHVPQAASLMWQLNSVWGKARPHPLGGQGTRCWYRDCHVSEVSSSILKSGAFICTKRYSVFLPIFPFLLLLLDFFTVFYFLIIFLTVFFKISTLLTFIFSNNINRFSTAFTVIILIASINIFIPLVFIIFFGCEIGYDGKGFIMRGKVVIFKIIKWERECMGESKRMRVVCVVGVVCGVDVFRVRHWDACKYIVSNTYVRRQCRWESHRRAYFPLRRHKTQSISRPLPTGPRSIWCCVGHQWGGGGAESHMFFIRRAPVEEGTLFEGVAVDVHYQSNVTHLRSACGEVWWK